MPSAILLIAHGSREERSNADFLNFVAEFSKKYPDGSVVGAFLELAQPSIAKGLEACASSGAEDIFVLPLMLFWGRHVKQDIPKIVDAARAKHPGVRFHYAGAIADRPEFLDYLLERARSFKEGV